MTDLNFYLGKLLPEHFPFPLDRAAVEARLAKLINEIAAATGRRYSPVELCDGFLRVANSNMVKAIQSISVAKGCDPREYVLVAFGGAAGQHACAVARELRMPQVLVHPDASLLSAYGIGLAHFDMERLGLEEGEEILPGITIHADGGVTGNFRVLCDGEHEDADEVEEQEVVEAIATQAIPVYSPPPRSGDA